ncbi:hypothetical protein [Streptomyces sparsogenes]|uniref:Uncharacterized protein n=1 Tax=Streptomyces sparsogenes DSM 40356 TaxID=1331668 RepID=A0A1R1S7U8_9ACTN|nr:hypothetical protein [Streptomyces sparsogenes]OMI34396.1 hypothetical protein SPAR_36471 [Streptomyces sparsogenes DSM 40356]
MNHAAEEYAWPTCTACGRDLWESEAGRLACRPCETRTGERLGELATIFQQINSSAALMRGARRGGAPTSGSRTPPIPPRLEVLSLAATGGVATRLRDIEDAWRAALAWTIAPWRGSPAQAVPEHLRFLINNLPWACDAYESVGQDVEEIRQLHAECKQALTHDRKPGRVSVGVCPVVVDGELCGAQLTASAANSRIRCGTCGAQWDDMWGWRELRQAQEAVASAGKRAA